MKPGAFEYFKPETLEEARGLLERYDPEAKILAGGQSLLPVMNFRLARPEVLVDINGIAGLDYIKEEGDELVIGALAREREIEMSPLVREKCPLLSEAISHIGHKTIRNRGTIGGSLVHADPSAEIPTAIVALSGKIKAVGPDGERTMGPEEFFLTYLTSALEPTEILTEVRIPITSGEKGHSFQELSRRCGDFAIVAVACSVTVGEDGTCSEAQIGLGGVASTPVRAEEAEEALTGQTLSDELFEKAGELAMEETDAESDYHASVEYREDMTRVLVKKGLKKAWEMAKGGK